MEAVCYNWHPEFLPLVFLTEGFRTSVGTDLQLYSEFQTGTVGESSCSVRVFQFMRTCS